MTNTVLFARAAAGGMKRTAGKMFMALFLFAVFAVGVFAAPAAGNNEERIFVSQKDALYNDLSTLAGAGLIKSKDADYFLYNPITKKQAAGFIIEARYYLGVTRPAEDAVDEKKFTKVINSCASGLQEEIKSAPAFAVVAVNESEAQSRLDGVEAAISDAESARNETFFNSGSSLKIEGIISAKYTDLGAYGVCPFNHSAFTGTYMQLLISKSFSSDLSLSMYLNLEPRYNDPVIGTAYPDFFTPSNIMDNFSMSLNAGPWKISGGTIWEDITSFIASQGPSDRPWIFERDQLAADEKAKDHYETIFRNYFQSLDDRWSKHPWMGLEVFNDKLFGRDQLKLMAGKANNFYTNYLYEFGARYTRRQDILFFSAAEWSANFYNTSNQKAEAFAMQDADPFGLIAGDTIAGGDVKATLFGLFKISGEFEYSNYYARYVTSTPMPYTQKGSAMYANLVPSFLPKQIYLGARYTRIDPDYVAPASGVSDTSVKSIDAADPAKVKLDSLTTISDPTTLENNMNKIEVSARLNVPYCLLRLNYGVSSQLRATGNMFYSRRYVIGTSIWWNAFYSNYGFLDTASGQHAAIINYNNNRYDYDPSLTTYRLAEIMAGGNGGLATDEWTSSREFMVSSDVTKDTIKYKTNAVADLRVELSRFVGLRQPLFLHAYGELNSLSNGTDYIVKYDPARLFSQLILTSTIVYNPVNNICILGYFGSEAWASKSTLPHEIDYLDCMAGLGADFDISGRAGLFIRVKNFFHKDKFISGNNFHGWQITGELKSFF